MYNDRNAAFGQPGSEHEAPDYWFDAIPDAEDGWFAMEEQSELEQQAEAERRGRL
ncbi:hypothetical protein SAMN02799630_00759 [Paenibacillus sp. UNCCL117]|uniref:hypothetical protein n=1 Tax=unclassified Paenibacillus TaxID=185978 RepID=UPI00087DF593|nr:MULTISPECIES: hypothetical protein [unclassified Paenibacillus]SDC19173.1 hypothetical protein SAMN04488602_101559 [Paenibacillus sp. cl123]SFW18340.1 hypothetical protein SAMN02799630_00759 [Paenibacillus sp. UNCCL117]